MQYRYATGELMQVGDRITENSWGGIIVAIIDSGEYGSGLVREHWEHLKTGILVDFDDGGLTHFSKKEQVAYFRKESL